MPFGKKTKKIKQIKNKAKQNKNNILEDLLSLILSQFKKYQPPRNLKFNYLGISQSLKLRISLEKILSISAQLNFTPNTLGCYGLTRHLPHMPQLLNEPSAGRNKVQVRFPQQPQIARCNSHLKGPIRRNHIRSNNVIKKSELLFAQGILISTLFDTILESPRKLNIVK